MKGLVNRPLLEAMKCVRDGSTVHESLMVNP